MRGTLQANTHARTRVGAKDEIPLGAKLLSQVTEAGAVRRVHGGNLLGYVINRRGRKAGVLVGGSFGEDCADGADREIGKVPRCRQTAMAHWVIELSGGAFDAGGSISVPLASARDRIQFEMLRALRTAHA